MKSPLNATNIVLYGSHPSPFVRRVRMALSALALPFEFKEVGSLHPPPSWFVRINPLGRIPTMQYGEEQPFIDSTLILDALDDRHGGVWPKELQMRWRDKHLSTLAVGAMTDAVVWVVESREKEPRDSTFDFCESALERTLQALEDQIASRTTRGSGRQRTTQGVMDVAIALDYLTFRLPHLVWRDAFPHLTGLLETLREDEAFAATAPR
jgi:glutathione S-transferase